MNRTPSRSIPSSRQTKTASINQRIEDAYRTLVYEETRKRYDALLRQSSEPPAPVAMQPAEKRYQAQPQQPSLSLAANNHYLKSAEPMRSRLRRRCRPQ